VRDRDRDRECEGDLPLRTGLRDLDLDLLRLLERLLEGVLFFSALEPDLDRDRDFEGDLDRDFDLDRDGAIS